MGKKRSSFGGSGKSAKAKGGSFGGFNQRRNKGISASLISAKRAAALKKRQAEKAGASRWETSDPFDIRGNKTEAQGAQSQDEGSNAESSKGKGVRAIKAKKCFVERV